MHQLKTSRSPAVADQDQEQEMLISLHERHEDHEDDDDDEENEKLKRMQPKKKKADSYEMQIDVIEEDERDE
jgi:hypothetical protein